MHVKYFYPWGYFHPIIYGCDRVAANHLEYFRARGWTVDCILPDDPAKQKMAEQFRKHYHWLNSVRVVEHLPTTSSLREMTFAFERLAQSPRLREALSGSADLFFTNYVFTSPIMEHLPRSCRRVLESIDIMTHQFTLAEKYGWESTGASDDALANALAAFSIRVEMDLYRLYDAVIMINADEQKLALAHGVTHTFYVPQMYEAATKPGASTPTDHKFDLIFVGSDHVPNSRGMDWFYRNVYVPYLWRHKVSLALVGRVCNCLDFQDAYLTRFSWVNGALDDLYAASKLTIVPIFHGTGMAIKTLEGLAMGRAMVVAPTGARGLDDAANAYVKIDMQAEPQRTAAVILDLLANPAKRERLEHAATAYVRRCFSREAFFGGMDRVMKSIGVDPTTARNGIEGTSRLKPPRIHASRPVAPVRSH